MKKKCKGSCMIQIAGPTVLPVTRIIYTCKLAWFEQFKGRQVCKIMIITVTDCWVSRVDQKVKI